MRIAVINGSPKGVDSVTLQYVRALEKLMPQHEFSPVHVAHSIRRLERDIPALTSLVGNIQSSDFILWSFPVYVTLVPGQLKRFVELVEENGLSGGFSGKPSAALSTSIRFFDHSALEYLHEISERWDMHCFRGYSAHMEDLLDPVARSRFVTWFGNVFEEAARREYPRRRYARETPVQPPPVRLPSPVVRPGPFRKVVLVGTETDPGSNLHAMVEYFKGCLPFPVEHFVLDQQTLRSGCLGCLNCVTDNVCNIRDRFSLELRDALHAADALVFAAPLKDVYFDSRFKMFQDRRFIDGHCPATQGKPLGIITSGPLRQLANTRFLLDAFTDLMGQPLVGPVTDEDSTGEIIRQLVHMADVIIHGQVPMPSPSFYSVAGMKLFRDFVWLRSAFFTADHRFYKKHGIYDFPQKQYKKRLENLGLSLAFSLPMVRKVAMKKMKHYMVSPFKRAVEEL